MSPSFRGGLSDSEAGTATATRGGLRILHLERRAAERFDEIDRAAGHQIEAHRVDHQPDPAGLADRIVGLGRIGEVELVLEARAAAAFDREAQDRRPALLAGDRLDAGGGRGGEGRDLAPCGRCRVPRAARSSGADVVAHRLGLVLGHVDAVLHEVADRDEARPARPARPPAGGGSAAGVISSSASLTCHRRLDGDRRRGHHFGHLQLERVVAVAARRSRARRARKRCRRPFPSSSTGIAPMRFSASTSRRPAATVSCGAQRMMAARDRRLSWRSSSRLSPNGRQYAIEMARLGQIVPDASTTGSRLPARRSVAMSRGHGQAFPARRSARPLPMPGRAISRLMRWMFAAHHRGGDPRAGADLPRDRAGLDPFLHRHRARHRLRDAADVGADGAGVPVERHRPRRIGRRAGRRISRGATPAAAASGSPRPGRRRSGAPG